MNNEDKILTLLEQMQGDIQQMQEQSNARFDDVENSIITLKKNMTRHNHEVLPLVKAVKEGMSNLLERNPQLNRLKEKSEDHENRIWALVQNAANQ